MRAALIAVAVFAGLVVACDEDEPQSAEDFLAAAADAMADESFPFTNDDCSLCDPPEVYEFTRANAAKLSHGSGHDAWAYALILNGEGYLSNDGRRWLAGSEALEFLSLALLDPRVILTAVGSPELREDETVSAREAVVVAGTLDVHKFFERLLPPLREREARDSLEPLLDGTSLRLWIDRDSYRVLQMELRYPEADEVPRSTQFEFGAVGIPMAIDSMDAEEADRLAEPVEKAGEKLLAAIAEYRARHGAYPPSLDPSTLAAEIPEGDWPRNPFSSQPVRQSPDTPGDFDYVAIDGGNHMRFTIYAWDHAQLHYDSARWGDPDHLLQQRR